MRGNGVVCCLLLVGHCSEKTDTFPPIVHLIHVYHNFTVSSNHAVPWGPAVSYDYAGPFRCSVGWIDLSAYLSPLNRIPSAHSSVPFIAFWVFWNRLQGREIHTVAEALRKNKIRNTFLSLRNDHAILRRRVSHIYSKAYLHKSQHVQAHHAQFVAGVHAKYS